VRVRVRTPPQAIAKHPSPSRPLRFVRRGRRAVATRIPHPTAPDPPLLALLASLLLLVETARARCPAPTATGQALIEQGDVAWVRGERGVARCAWRAAADSEDPAVRAMAELRRLRISGNLGLAIHGPQADRALAACPPDAPWCRIARADRALIVTELGVGEEHALAAAHAASLVAEGMLPLPATVRAAQAGAVSLDQLSAEVAATSPGAPGEPLGRALVDAGGMPSTPGTWSLGVGVVAAPGLGAGPVLRFTHPDLAWRGWGLMAQGHVTTGGAAGLSAGMRTRPATGGVFLTTGAAARRDLLPRYAGDGSAAGLDTVLELLLRAAPGWQGRPAAAWLGPLLRADRPAGADAWVHGHGLFGGVGATTGDRVRLRSRLDGELAVVGSTHLQLVLDTVLEHPAPLGARLAWRLIGSGSPLAASPTWRLPAWGGGDVLRCVPLARFRAPWMAAAVGEWRQPLGGALGVAFFGELAAAPDLHGGGGLGLRLDLPPRPSETIRLDAGIGDEGFALTAGFGAAF